MTTMLDSIGHAPTPDDIRAAIDRITVSDVFSRSPQLGAFLRFVVEAVLHGKANRIKAYTIGVEVLRRDTRFDPQLDPIVRVEATRLRRAIERYYAGPGLDDPIVIDLPRGTYVPTFRRREADGSATAQIAPRAGCGTLRSRPALAGLIAAVALLLIGGGLLLRQSVAVWRCGRQRRRARHCDAAGPRDRCRPATACRRSTSSRCASSERRPPSGLAVDPLFEKINDAFARFDTINVVYAPRATRRGRCAAGRAARRLSAVRRAGIPRRAHQRAVSADRCRPRATSCGRARSNGCLRASKAWRRTRSSAR